MTIMAAAGAATEATILSIAHVPDAPRRYPGDVVRLITRVDVFRPVESFTLRIGLPDGLTLVSTSAGAGAADGASDLLVVEGERYVLWTHQRPAEAGGRFHYALAATVDPVGADFILESRALVAASGPGRSGNRAAETASVLVSAQAGALKYLPGLYAEQDDLMGRFLMLFESYWQPLDNMIGSMHHYLDPRTAPTGLLPWLARCVDLTLNDAWTEAQKRRLIGSALQLYRTRGTRRGLQLFLEIYTGQTPQIIEHRANNLRLGPEARLASSIALGQRNVPHTFTVVLGLPDAGGETSEDRRRLDSARRRMIDTIISTEKPAHTAYTLEIVRQADTSAASDSQAVRAAPPQGGTRQGS
jgi:phage tail-like protein